MVDLTSVLHRHQVVGFDTSIFIYQLEASPRYVDVATSVLDGLMRAEYRGVISVLTLMEIAVRPLQLGRIDVADEYETLLAAFPNLAVAEIDRPVARRAASIRATFRLRPADAIQVAACMEHGATAFITNDKGLRRVNLLDVLVLDDYLEISNG